MVTDLPPQEGPDLLSRTLKKKEMSDCVGGDETGPFRKVSCDLSMKSGVTEWLKSSSVLNS